MSHAAASALSSAIAPNLPDYAKQVAALQSAAAYCPALTGFALLQVSGEDAATFLQGQLSNDVRLLNGENAQYTGYSNAKGRLLASFLLWRHQDDYFLLLAADLASSIQRRLSMFILRSKVTIRVCEDYLIQGFKGVEAEVALLHAGIPLPSEPLILGHAPAGGWVMRLSGGGILHILPVSQSTSFIAALPAALVPVSPEAWSLLEIAAGIPWVTQATQEQFVAQMVNMDIFGAISFTKGCYPGQEIIARTHYLGKVKRRLYRVALPVFSAPGTPLYSPAVADQSIGMLVNVADDGNGAYQALAVVQTPCWPDGVYMDQALQHSITNLSLPYFVDVE